MTKVFNPLENVPLNKKKCYVRGVTPGGCEVYMPVDSYDEEKLLVKKTQLQIYLNNKDVKPPNELA